jgi:hypothetical protein
VLLSLWNEAWTCPRKSTMLHSWVNQFNFISLTSVRAEGILLCLRELTKLLTPNIWDFSHTNQFSNSLDTNWMPTVKFSFDVIAHYCRAGGQGSASEDGPTSDAIPSSRLQPVFCLWCWFLNLRLSPCMANALPLYPLLQLFLLYLFFGKDLVFVPGSDLRPCPSLLMTPT